MRQRPPRGNGKAANYQTFGEAMSTNVAPAREPEDYDVIGYALTGWGRTARLCTIQLCRALPAVATVLAWWLMRR